jgi:hypothetical protein
MCEWVCCRSRVFSNCLSAERQCLREPAGARADRSSGASGQGGRKGQKWPTSAKLLRGAKCCSPSGGHGLAAVGCSSACYDGGNLRSEQASCLRCDLACRSAVLARVASMATAGQSFDCARTAHTRLTATPAVVATPFANAGLLLLAAVLLRRGSARDGRISVGHVSAERYSQSVAPP